MYAERTVTTVPKYSKRFRENCAYATVRSETHAPAHQRFEELCPAARGLSRFSFLRLILIFCLREGGRGAGVSTTYFDENSQLHFKWFWSIVTDSM